MNYQETIRQMDSTINAVGVECSMRVQFGTLDHLGEAEFVEEIELARQMEESEPGILARLADSYGMGREYCGRSEPGDPTYTKAERIEAIKFGYAQARLGSTEAEVAWIQDLLKIESAKEGPYYVNLYDTNRQYGGPEEGGWWYDSGEFVECRGVFGSLERAEQAADSMEADIAQLREGLYPPGSMLCTGWPLLRVQDHAGKNYPEKRPHYE